MESTEAVEKTIEAPNVEQTVLEPTPKSDTNESPLFELNEPAEVTFNARPGAPNPVMVTHKLRRPTYDELYARELKTAYRTRDVGQDEEEVLPSGEDSNVYLYDKTVLEVSGGYSKEKKIDFTVFGDDKGARQEALKRVPPTHKNQVISAIYAFDSEIEYGADELDNFIWGEGETYRIKTEVGLDVNKADFTLYHTLREPTEGELIAFNRDKARIIIERGTKRPVSKVMTNIGAAVKLYDTLIQSVEGMSYDGRPVDVGNSKQLKAIDPIMKQSAVSALVKSVQLDLGK